VFMAMVVAGAHTGKHWGGGAVVVAIAVSIYFALEAPVKMFLALRPMSGSIRDVVTIFIPPLVLGGLAITIAALLVNLLLVKLLPTIPFGDWVRLALTTAVGGGLFLLAARQLMPQMWRSIWDRALALLRARRG